MVVQERLEGEVLASPPQTDVEWERLLRHYATVHSLTPSLTCVPIPEAVYDAASIQTGKRLVYQQAEFIPRSAQPAPLETLLRRLESLPVRRPLKSTRTLCHVDANVSNFILRADRLYAVDWEGSGWGHPAFEIANLMAHPAYLSVPFSRWGWVAGEYAKSTNKPTLEEDILAHYPVLVVFWVARFARMLYEVPRGLDKRLVCRPNDWKEDVRRKYQRYLTLAERLLRG